MQNQTLIFIPDISGFTSFVNETAIEHSQHIISELLEIIIESDLLGFTISEIEGDAILFYKKGEIPDVSDIIKQSKAMFMRFHSHLIEIENNNVCQCGACRSASNLSLKFITHIGDTKEVTINKFDKLIGSDLILAHRLLKNNIESKEYLLFSENFYKDYSVGTDLLEDWISLKLNEEEIEEFGKISSRYIDFNPLLNQIPDFIKENKSAEEDKKPDITISINAPILLVHNLLTDANAKYDFVPGLKSIKTDSKINRINSGHTCVFDNLEIHFVTKNNSVENNGIRYSEEAELTKGFKFITDYKLQEIDDKTEMQIFIFKPKLLKDEKESLFKKIKDYLFLKFIVANNKKGIKLFKEYCEKKHRENEQKWK